MENDDVTTRNESRLTSRELAELIVDALLRAQIVQESELIRAIDVVTEEIDARKIVGDY